ncbi:MAG: hypothetical protein LC803_09760 [Acidobacteria bacterium]|nr:hypothetical protein [Acidobacteriota bacterium]
MDKTQEDIIRFELMLRATDPQQRTRAYDGLQIIIERWQGTPYAKRAKQILDETDRQRQKDEKDPELSAFANRWIGIHKLTDVGLPKFLRELQAKPAIAAHLRSEVIKDLRQWISEALPHIGRQTPAEGIKALTSFVEMISGLETYEAEMKELKQLRNTLFQVRYENARKEIVAALNTWSFDEAWRALQQLSNPPASFEREVTQLQEDIYKADQKCREVIHLFDKSPQVSLAKWSEAADLVNYAQELSGYLHADVPEEWQQRLGAIRRKSVQKVAGFLEKKAGQAREFHEIKKFQAAYEKLAGENRDAAVPLRKEWFQNALNLFTQNLEKEIAKSDTPEALDVICLSLTNEQLGLPHIFAEEMNVWRNRIDEISLAWKAIRTGGEFPHSMPSREPLPEAFLKAVEFFVERLKRVREAFEKLEISEGPNASQAYLEAVRTADEILHELGNHALALELKEQAERKITYRQINDAVAEWQIERLLELCCPRQQDPECAYYIAHKQHLRALQELVEQKAFSGSREAEGWWQLWRERCDRLPPPIPEALSQALLREQENRADQWHAVLAALIARPLSPEECEQIAASLKGELNRLDLKWRQTGFLHKATVGYGERFIKSKNWQSAEEKIAELDEDHESTRWLKTFLSVERAREIGVVALSQVLKRDWSHITLYLKSEAHVILAEAVAEAWERKEFETLKNLRMVVSRLLATGDTAPEILREFARWEEWLNVESDIRSEGGIAGIKKLVSYLSAQALPDATLGKRLERLISYWLEQQDSVMLAWAYEAFRDYVAMPVSRPVEDLKEQNFRLAVSYEKALRSDGQLELAHLKTMQSKLKNAEDEWTKLTGYLNELPHVVTGIKLPAKFYEVKELLSRLIEIWTTLEQLQNADFRQEVELERLAACRRILASKFEGIALQGKLLAQEQQLEPLTNLTYLQNRIMDAAAKCGSDDEWEEKGVFIELAKCLRNMIEVFRKIGAEGGTLWRLISAEYCITVHARAGSLLPKPTPPDLSVLAAQFAKLEAEEETLRQVWQELWQRKPVIPSRSTFEAESYLDYLGLFPTDPPHSRRGYLQFKRNFAMSEPIPTILAQSRRYLPEWICKYLDEGIPQYAPEA